MLPLAVGAAAIAATVTQGLLPLVATVVYSIITALVWFRATICWCVFNRVSGKKGASARFKQLAKRIQYNSHILSDHADGKMVSHCLSKLPLFSKNISHFLCSVALQASLARRFIASSRGGSAAPSNICFLLSVPSPYSTICEAVSAAATLCPFLEMKGLAFCKLPGGFFLAQTYKRKK